MYKIGLCRPALQEIGRGCDVELDVRGVWGRENLRGDISPKQVDATLRIT